MTAEKQCRRFCNTRIMGCTLKLLGDRFDKGKKVLLYTADNELLGYGITKDLQWQTA